MQRKLTYAVLLTALASMASAFATTITLDGSAGTNLVAEITTGQVAAGGMVLPIVEAVLVIGGILGLYRVLFRKGRVGT